MATPLSSVSSSSSLKKLSPVTTKTGNALAQFMIFSALTCVAYQFLVTRFIYAPVLEVSTVPVAGGNSYVTGSRLAPTSTSWSDTAALENHRAKRKETMSTTEFSCFVACVGLFGLMQRKKHRSEIEARIKAQRYHAAMGQLTTSQLHNTIGATDTGGIPVPATTSADRFADLPSDVKEHVLLYLQPQELVVCAIVNTAWHETVGDRAEFLWKHVFQRDFYETGERFATIFPRVCWRQYYFFHHLSRPVEIARWLGQTQQRKCVVVQGLVYDVTTFLERHPGGTHVLGDVIGTDATDVWEQFQHSTEAQEMMKEFLVYDVVLDERQQKKRTKLQGNLAIVRRRWEHMLWCIGHAHLFGDFSMTFMDVSLRIATWRTKANAKVFYMESLEE